MVILKAERNERKMRKVIITGGSRGIGAACVRAFSDAGDRVAFIYKSNDEAAEKLASETGAFAVKSDISNGEGARAAMSAAMSELCGVDVLVNNAGISYIGLFSDMTDEEYRRIMATDLDSAVYCTRAVVDTMVRQKSGSIICVSSMWGQVGASCEVAYSTAKAALIGFTKALAKELGPSGINVNCVAPGVIATEMNAELGDDVLLELADETPLCRIGSASEVADAIMYLASDAASFITGQVLAVNGGIIV